MTAFELEKLLEELAQDAEVQIYATETDTVYRIESAEIVEDDETGRRVLLIEVK